MAEITSSMVKELRQRTGSGVMECKKALVESEGDIEKAIDVMRKSGYLKAAKKSSLTTTEGMIFIKQSVSHGIILELNCQTDFVSKDSNFKEFGNKIVDKALKESIKDTRILKEMFEDDRATLVAKLGENINIRRISFIEGESLSSYVHGHGKIGVIVSSSDARTELLKKIALHIAAMHPEYLTHQDIPNEVIKREYKIQFDIAMSSGKPAKISEKIVEGRMKKIRK